MSQPFTAPATVLHPASITKTLYNQKTKPDQIPVITVDQPVYALWKQLQWMYPDEWCLDHELAEFSDSYWRLAKKERLDKIVQVWISQYIWAKSFLTC